MLHLDTPPALYRDFWKRHAPAKRVGFGRLFRSPTLFEDIIKTITGCNVAWANTKSMNRLLCEKIGTGGAFPTPAELARCTPGELKRKCKVGYRADRIIRFARDVDSGKLDLTWFEAPARTTDELYHALREIHGIGDYAANNILQHLDRYDRLPVDSETLRHFREVHRHDGDAKQIAAAARDHYQRFAPHQFLAYWYELWHRTSVEW
jgi:3-methyladenine DNA glycosylase/8-oxoguanine DNA glycosylase